MFAEWLEANRIYFEILAPVLLSLAATFIAFASYLISRHMRQVGKDQFRVMAAGLEPHFVLQKEIRMDDKDFGCSEWLIVWNIGAPVHDIDVDPLAFIEVPYRVNGKIQTMIIHLRGYYYLTRSAQSHSGEISHHSGHQNHETWYEFVEQQRQWVTKDSKILWCSLVSITSITYKNELGEDKVQYFRDTTSIDEELAKRYLDKTDVRHYYNSIRLEELSLERVYEVVGNLET